MSAHNTFSFVIFAFTLALAMMLRVVSLCSTCDVFNPDWIALALIYWSIALPERIGVFTAFVVGLLTDVLTGCLLGQYALIYVLISYFSIKEHRRLRQFPLIQQCAFVLFCLLLGRSLIFAIELMQASANHLPASFWYSALSGALVWPLVFLVLRAIRLFARIT